MPSALTGCPLIKRKTLLKRILPKANTSRIRFTDHILGNGEALFKRPEALNVEGMVMKRKDSVDAFSRCRDWLKVQTAARKDDDAKPAGELAFNYFFCLQSSKP